MTPDQYCQDKASQSASSFYYSFLFLEPEKRQAMTALYAFCREVDDIVDDCKEAAIAQKKLAWWKQSMRDTFDGSPSHPIQHALLPAIQRYQLPLSYFLDIIDGMEMDLNQSRYQHFDDLALYCYRVAGAVGLLAAAIFGYRDVAVETYAKYLGLAFQLTNIIRDIQEDAQRNRIYIPLDELQQFDVDPQDLLQSHDSENMQRLLAFQIERAQSYYQKAFAALPHAEREAQRCGIIMSAIYFAVLEKIAKRPAKVLQGRVRLSAWKKLWLAWNTARSEKQQNYNRYSIHT